MTTTKVAALLKRSVSNVRARAIEHGIGEAVHDRLRVYSPADVAKLRRIFAERKNGRPRKSLLE